MSVADQPRHDPRRQSQVCITPTLNKVFEEVPAAAAADGAQELGQGMLRHSSRPAEACSSAKTHVSTPLFIKGETTVPQWNDQNLGTLAASLRPDEVTQAL
jgi:hypothetical protein